MSYQQRLLFLNKSMVIPLNIDLKAFLLEVLDGHFRLKIKPALENSSKEEIVEKFASYWGEFLFGIKVLKADFNASLSPEQLTELGKAAVRKAAELKTLPWLANCKCNFLRQFLLGVLKYEMDNQVCIGKNGPALLEETAVALGFNQTQFEVAYEFAVRLHFDDVVPPYLEKFVLYNINQHYNRSVVRYLNRVPILWNFERDRFIAHTKNELPEQEREHTDRVLEIILLRNKDVILAKVEHYQLREIDEEVADDLAIMYEHLERYFNQGHEMLNRKVIRYFELMFQRIMILPRDPSKTTKELFKLRNEFKLMIGVFRQKGLFSRHLFGRVKSTVSGRIKETVGMLHLDGFVQLVVTSMSESYRPVDFSAFQRIAYFLKHTFVNLTGPRVVELARLMQGRLMPYTEERKHEVLVELAELMLCNVPNLLSSYQARECQRQLTYLLNDMHCSNIRNRAFKKRNETPVDLKVEVVGGLGWPVRSEEMVPHARLPTELLWVVTEYREMFKEEFPPRPRRLEFLLMFGRAEIKATFVNTRNVAKDYTFHVSTLQMFILMMFNEHKVITFEHLARSYNVPRKFLKMTLSPLVACELLLKAPDDEYITHHHVFTLNETFWSRNNIIHIGNEKHDTYGFSHCPIRKCFML